MLAAEQVLFSIHEYDRDGDMSDTGVFLHFGDTRVKVGINLEEFKKFVARVSSMVEEIEENYASA